MRQLSFILLFSVLFFSCENNKKSSNANENQVPIQERVQPDEAKNSKTPELINVGDELTLYNHQQEEMLVLFKEINIIELSKGIYNLVIKVQFKNNMSYPFIIMDSDWKLTNTDMIEIDESGVYDFTFESFTPTLFSLVMVDAGFGKIEEVGYQVDKGTYYLHIEGMNVGKIVIN